MPPATEKQPVSRGLAASFDWRRLSFYQVERSIFYALLLAWLLPVFSGRYFITGDGPCHVYNAKVLLDWARGQNVDFYRDFYLINPSFEPNWFSHLALMAALSVFPAALADQIFAAFYVLAFGLGFRYLLRQINPNGIYLSSMGLLFAFHHVFQMGFYNYACSIAFMFWAIGYWIRHWGQPEPAEAIPASEPGAGKVLGFALLLLLNYSAHPLGLSVTGLALACLIGWRSLMLLRRRGVQEGLSLAWRLAVPALVAALPALLLYAEFMLRRAWGSPPDGDSPMVLWERLSHLTALITLNTNERDIAFAVAIFCALTLAVAVVARWRARTTSVKDGLFLVFLAALYLYFKPPGHFSGGGMLIPIRLQIVPFLALLWWCALARPPLWFRWLSLGFAATVTAAFLAKRLPHHREASVLVEEYMECREHIRDRSFVLPLHYDLNGANRQGQMIANSIWLFNHSTGYLADGKTLIMADNYEALRWYFPLVWHSERDPYAHTSKEGVDFENLPPRADIARMNTKPHGYPIDYVLLLSYDDRQRDHPYVREVRDQLEQGYTEIFRSSHGKAILFERKRQ